MILAYVEHDGGVPDRLSLEALTLARRLAEVTGASLGAIVLGEGAAAVVPSLGAYGVTRANVAEAIGGGGYAPAAWGRAVASIVDATEADAVVGPPSDRATEVLATAAAIGGAQFAANCTDVRAGDPWDVTRQRWGGSLLEDARLDGSPRYLTVAPHAIAPEPAATATSPQVEDSSPAVTDADQRARLIRREEPAAGTISLGEARVVVGGGRGVGSAEGFAVLQELAAVLGGTIGVSRAVTSAGWRPHSEQVGQTGARIAPDLYIACGISGAIQHIVGCKAAKRILAINIDPDAPIMGRADYAVIGDLKTVVPAITEEIRRVAAR